MTLIALGLCLTGMVVPVPGLEMLGLAPSGGPAAGIRAWLGVAPPLVGITGLGLGLMVLLRAVVALLEPDPRLPERPSPVPAIGVLRPARSGTRASSRAGEIRVPWRALAMVVYLVICALQAATVLRYVEQAEGGGAPWSADLAFGWSFRLAALATMLGGSALVWVLATWITREGVGHGPLVIFGAVELVGGADRLFATGGRLGAGMVGAWSSWMQLAAVGPLVVGALALWRWPPARWPAFFVGAPRVPPLLSPVDLLILPAVVWSLIASQVWMLGGLLQQTGPETLDWLQGLLPLMGSALSAALLLGWIRLRHRLGSVEASAAVPSTLRTEAVASASAAAGDSVPSAETASSTSRARGRPAFAAVALATPLVAVALLLGGYAAAGGWQRDWSPGPYAGDRSYEVLLQSASGGGLQDAPRLLARLEALGVRGEIIGVSEGQISLRLIDVRAPEGVLDAVLPGRRLAFHLAAVDQGPLDPRRGGPPPAGLTVEDDHDGGRIYVGPTARSLAPLLERLVQQPGQLLRIECRAPEGRQCHAQLLDERPIVTGADVADASVEIDPHHGIPAVQLRLSPDAARRFADATGANVGRKLAIVLDDRIVMAPVIHDRIAGGRAQVHLGREGNPDELRRQADELVVALRSGALVGSWVRGSVRRSR